MKHLPEVARLLVEDAREAHGPNGAHGPSEAQMHNMLASLHAKLGYTAGADAPPPAAEAAGSSAHHAQGLVQGKVAGEAAHHAQGLLHAKLLKLALSLAALGGMVAMIAPRIWSSEPVRTPAPIAARASATKTVDTGAVVAQAAPAGAIGEPAALALEAATSGESVRANEVARAGENAARALEAASGSKKAARALEAPNGGAADTQRANEEAVRVSRGAAEGALRGQTASVRGSVDRSAAPSAEPQNGRASSVRRQAPRTGDARRANAEAHSSASTSEQVQQAADLAAVPAPAVALSGAAANLQPAEPERSAEVGARPSPRADVAVATERVTSAEGAQAGGVQAERVQLTDVVPIQSARSRQQQRAARGGATDADELALIERAASRLRDGEHQEALELLQEHGRKFPRSQLELERRGLSVLAQCGAGQLEQGRGERATFLRDAGQTPLATRVRRACSAGKP